MSRRPSHPSERRSRCSADVAAQQPHRLIRPVERQPMRGWIEDLLNSGEVPSLSWSDRDRGEFKIKWCHGSRHGWSLKDADLFERWARHTGRYCERKDPKRWKANFRCALNSLKDITEVTDKSQAKGSNAFRVYRMGNERRDEKKPKMKKLRSSLLNKYEEVLSSRHNTRSQRLGVTEDGKIKVENQANAMEADDEEYSSDSASEMIAPKAHDNIKLEIPQSSTNLPKFEEILPEFERIVFGKRHVLPLHHSGYTVDMIKKPIPEQLQTLSGISLPDCKFTTQSPNTTVPPGSSPSYPDNSHSDAAPFSPDSHHELVTFPDTPEDSDAASLINDLTDEEFIEVSLIEVSEEVTIESTMESSTDYTITDIGNVTSPSATRCNTMLPTLSAMFYTCQTNSNGISYNGQMPLNTWPEGFVPLTPPGQN